MYRKMGLQTGDGLSSFIHSTASNSSNEASHAPSSGSQLYIRIARSTWLAIATISTGMFFEIFDKIALSYHSIRAVRRHSEDVDRSRLV